MLENEAVQVFRSIEMLCYESEFLWMNDEFTGKLQFKQTYSGGNFDTVSDAILLFATSKINFETGWACFESASWNYSCTFPFRLIGLFMCTKLVSIVFSFICRHFVNARNEMSKHCINISRRIWILLSSTVRGFIFNNILCNIFVLSQCFFPIV